MMSEARRGSATAGALGIRHGPTPPGDAASGLLVRRLDGLIGMLSHDLRTPLSAISGWLFLLESGKLDADGQKRALSKIKASVEEQVQLIDDTLLISRGQMGRVEIDPVPVPVRERLQAAIDGLRPQAAAKNVTIESDGGPGNPTIEGDGELLQRSFDLLLAHALKQHPPADG
jgi:signal transduction histidine kinase